MKDKFLESLRKNGKYSNTIKRTKWYDGIDLTINQSFKEEYEEVEKPDSNYIVIGDRRFVIESRVSSDDDFLNNSKAKEEQRFFLPEIKKQESEVALRKKYGCECCGRKLIFPFELKWSLCSECDRIMFSSMKARKFFPDLPDSVTAPDRIFYKPQLNPTIRLNGITKQGALHWILNIIKRKKFNKVKSRKLFSPFLREVD